MAGADIIFLVSRKGMGQAVPELQLKFSSTYFMLHAEHNILPGASYFYTEGVRIADEGSAILYPQQTAGNLISL